MGAGHTISNPSTAHKAARLPLPWETPNSSNTAVNDRSNEIIDCADMMFAVVRWAKNWIYRPWMIRENVMAGLYCNQLTHNRISLQAS